MAQVVIALTSSGINKWRVPADCTSITIELIGAGGGYDGLNDSLGGGGAYTKLTGFAVTPLQNLTYYVQGDAWISNTGSVPTNTSQGAKAAGASGTSNITGGLAANCIPSAGAFSGGDGGSLVGAGGAAGPNGNGGSGASTNGIIGGGGGGANGGSNGTLGVGGNGRSGTGGGAIGTNGTTGTGGGGGGSVGAGAAGGGAQDNVWTDWLGNVYGPGGGSGGIQTASGPTLTLGAGYGSGYCANFGLIIITYTPVTTAGTYTEVFSVTGTTPWRVPLGVTSVKAEAIGAGSRASGAISGFGGGGGGYSATNAITVAAENATYVNVPDTPVYGSQANAWFNTSNAAPSSTTTGVLAFGGLNGTGGATASAVGDVKNAGGNGGQNNTTATGTKLRGGGGGGAAGPTGIGKNGSAGWNTGTTTGAGGGGGGSNGGSSGAATASTATVGGAGGAGTSGAGSGSGATASVAANAGTVGGGGGGGSANINFINGANGGASVVTAWTDSINTLTYGPGGGGGGAGCTSTVPGSGGRGGSYGGGGGGAYSTNAGSGGQGLVVLTYTMANVVAGATGNMFLMF